jgi:hypothetical protein
VELHLSEFIGMASHPDMYKIRSAFFFDIRLHWQFEVLLLLVNSIHLCLNLLTSPDLKFCKSSHCTVLDPITVDVKASYFCIILDTPACPLAII